MSDLDTFPVLFVGRETLRLKNSLEAVHVLAIAHVALGLVDPRLLGDVAPVSKIWFSVSRTLLNISITYR